MASFFTANERWEKQREFTLLEMGDDMTGAPELMEHVTLGQIIHNRRDRLIYLFDLLGDRAYYLELTGAYEARRGPSIRARSTPGRRLPTSTTPRRTATTRRRGRPSTR